MKTIDKKKNLINGQKLEFGNIDQIKVLQSVERKKEQEKEYKDFYNSLSPGAKYFDDLSSIDWVFMVIKLKIEKITEKLNGRSPVTIMIDQATGYEKSLLKSFLVDLKEGYTELVKLFGRIDEPEQKEQYATLLEKIEIDLKTNYKGVKTIKYD